MAPISDYSEASIEAQVRDLFLTAGWYALKTDAAMVIRGGKRRGTIAEGFPDRIFLLGLGERGVLTLAALVELKTSTGKLREAQVERHAELREWYGIHPHLIRSPQEALHIIDTGRRLKAALKEHV